MTQALGPKYPQECLGHRQWSHLRLIQEPKVHLESESCSAVSGSLWPHGLYSPILEWVAFPFSRGSSQPGIKPRCPAMQADSLPVEPQGKSKNTGVGSLSLLQQIFPTQESNQGLLQCRQILYQLNYQRSPKVHLGYQNWHCHDSHCLAISPKEKSTDNSVGRKTFGHIF